MNLESRRNALAITIGWWLLRRKLHKRADATVARLLAGVGIGEAPTSKRRHRLGGLILALTCAGGVWVAWNRLRGGHDDDGGTWTPEPSFPPPAPPAERAPAPPAPAPMPDPVAA